MDCFGTYFTHAQTCDKVRVSGLCVLFLGAVHMYCVDVWYV